MAQHPFEFYFPAPVAQHFCTQCGSVLTRTIPPLDDKERDVCEHCGAIHYRNPLMVVGTIPVFKDQILLCRRAIEPRYNTWTLPAGFMELNESTSQGALRETLEEAGAQATLGSLITVIDVPLANQVHFFYLAYLESQELSPGPETLYAEFFPINEIPWDELSFETVIQTLKYYQPLHGTRSILTKHLCLNQ